ncbi:MAG: large repetitive protein, partial [Actinomycetota bacterium]|nr:large repetitive protein [Actinomycetota bacterium]
MVLPWIPWRQPGDFRGDVMRASVFVGRVGGLAVALGVGAAAGCLTSGVAGASPDESTDSSARSEATAAGATREGSSGSGLRSRLTRSAAQGTSSGGREAGGVKGARGPVVKNDPGSAAASGRVESDGLASVLPAESVLPPVRVSTEVAEDRLLGPTASVPVEAMPVASTVVGLVPGVAEADADASVMAPATATSGAMEAVDEGWSGLVPGGPGELAASWVMVAAARRETRSRAILLGTAARTVAAGGLPDAERLPTAAAAVVGEDSVHAVAPAAAEVSVDPITAIVQQVQAVISGIVEAVTQFVNRVVTVVSQIVTSIVNIFVPTVPVNSAPTVANPTVGVPDSVTGAVTGIVSATDADGDVLTYSAPAGTSKGSVAIDSSTGAFTYAPTVNARENAAKVGATDAEKADSFTVTVTDGKGGSADVAISVVISPLATTPTNSAPVVGSPTVGVPDAITGVVAGTMNASDPDGDPLSYTAPASTGKGTVAIDVATGEFTYTPTAAARQNAANVAATPADKSDTFTVTVSDGQGGSTTAPVTVVIAPAVATPSNNAPVAETPPVVIPNLVTGIAVGQITATDPDGDSLTYSGTTTTSKGAVVVSSDGSFVYTPTLAARHSVSKVGTEVDDLLDTFTVTASDGRGGSVAVPVVVYVLPLNAAPVPGNTVVSVPDTSTGVVTGSMTATDADGDVLTYTVSATPSKGSVLIAPDGTFVYTPTADARHDAANPAPAPTMINTIDAHTMTPAMAISADGNRLYVADQRSQALIMIDTATDVVTASVEIPNMPSNVAISPDGTRAYVTTSTINDSDTPSGSLIVVDTETRSIIATVTGLLDPNGVAVSPDGSRVYVVDGVARTVQVVDTDTNTIIATIQDVFGTRGVAVSPDGSRVYVTGGSTVSVINTATNTLAATITGFNGVAGTLSAVAISPDGASAYLTNGSGSIWVVDTATNTVTGSIGDLDRIVLSSDIAISPDGKYIYMTAPSDVSVIDIDLGTPIASIPALEGGPFAVSPDGTRLYRSSSRSVDVFDTYGNAIDTFTVTVTDGYGGTTSIPVIVGIAPVNSAPVAGIPAVGTPDASTGVVTGSVTATDADGDILTYSGSTTTSKGNVVVDPTGGLTYTPTAEARINAARVDATEAEKLDTFTVLVTDGYGGAVATTVNVVVVPIQTGAPTVAINVRDYSGTTEGDSGSHVVFVPVELSRASDQEITVDYQIGAPWSSA